MDIEDDVSNVLQIGLKSSHQIGFRDAVVYISLMKNIFYDFCLGHNCRMSYVQIVTGGKIDIKVAIICNQNFTYA